MAVEVAEIEAAYPAHPTVAEEAAPVAVVVADLVAAVAAVVAARWVAAVDLGVADRVDPADQAAISRWCCSTCPWRAATSRQAMLSPNSIGKA